METFPPDRQPILRLAAVGDVGTANQEEYRTAATILDVAEQGWYDVLLLLGDNVYPEGDPTLLTNTVFTPFGPCWRMAPSCSLCSATTTPQPSTAEPR